MRFVLLGDVGTGQDSGIGRLWFVIKDFAVYYRALLPGEIQIEPLNALASFQSLLTTVRQTSYRLYLLIDEYDNFANLTRIFSVAQFYHFAFMVVSLALLGFGASGTNRLRKSQKCSP